MDERFDWDDYYFQQALDRQAIADTFTTDDYIDYPDLVNYTKRYGGPVRTRSYLPQNAYDRYNRTTQRLQQRDQYLEEQRVIVARNREERMLRELEEYAEQQNARLRAQRNRNIAILRLQLKKQLNK